MAYSLTGWESIFRKDFWVDLIVASPDIGEPHSKASGGGQIDILKGMEGISKSELLRGSGRQVLIRFKVRPEAFPTGLPMSG